jgi:Ca2+-binding EF-hand superfamily protein
VVYVSPRLLYGFRWNSITFVASAVDLKELEVLYRQFNSMDHDQDGYITQKEFTQGLGNELCSFIFYTALTWIAGAFMNDEVLANALFVIMDEEKDNRIDFKVCL